MTRTSRRPDLAVSPGPDLERGSARVVRQPAVITVQERFVGPPLTQESPHAGSDHLQADSTGNSTFDHFHHKSRAHCGATANTAGDPDS
jgi:hypothetical protein